MQVNPDYVPPEQEIKQVFGVVFEQGHNFLEINESCLQNIVTDNKELPQEAKEDLIADIAQALDEVE